MPKISGPSRTGLFYIFVAAVFLIAIVSVCTGQSYNITTNSTYTSNLVLNVYVNDAGKVLVNGYADNIDGLSFLKDSQYKYDKDAKQLYALTDSLTYKSGEDWEAKLPSSGNYSEYHSTFYLLASVKISKIDVTPGLEYLVSASNDSFQVDLHGYDIKSPTVTIDYQLPISESGISMAANDTAVASSSSYLIPASALSGLALVCSAIIIWRRRKRAALASKDNMIKGSRVENAKLDGTIHEASVEASDDNHNPELPQENRSPESRDATGGKEESGEVDNSSDNHNQLENSEPRYMDLHVAEVDDNHSKSGNDSNKGLSAGSNADGTVDNAADNTIDKTADNNADNIAESISSNRSPAPDKSSGADHSIDNKSSEAANRAISITSEMAAVMETLTDREKAVLKALIDHNGRMIQADIRYETRIPKSSLTGILLSLERRKLVTKKEMGRTNIIELSEWFLSKKKMQ